MTVDEIQTKLVRATELKSVGRNCLVLKREDSLKMRYSIGGGASSLYDGIPIVGEVWCVVNDQKCVMENVEVVWCINTCVRSSLLNPTIPRTFLRTRSSCCSFLQAP
jgi:hypothetical protein